MSDNKKREKFDRESFCLYVEEEYPSVGREFREKASRVRSYRGAFRLLDEVMAGGKKVEIPRYGRTNSLPANITFHGRIPKRKP
jgi:hypothetical protein